jgi:hypothetical protein
VGKMKDEQYMNSTLRGCRKEVELNIFNVLNDKPLTLSLSELNRSCEFRDKYNKFLGKPLEVRERMKKYYQEHKKELRERMKKYRQEHKEKEIKRAKSAIDKKEG